MDDITIPRDSKEQEAYKRELERRAFDSIRIYNPTDDDFIINWDVNSRHLVPNKNKDIGFGKGQLVTYRYLAEFYRRHMKDKIINMMADKALGELKDKFEKSGLDNWLHKANEQFQNTSKFRTDNPELVEKIFRELWIKVEKEFGNDTLESEDKPTNALNHLSVEEQISRKLEKEGYNRTIPVEQPVVSTSSTDVPISLDDKKAELIKEVSQP
jgi:hypothetical protein